MTSHSRDFSSLSSSFSTSPGASFNTRRERSCSPSSRYGACSSPITGASNNFSSSSLTGSGRYSYPKISINKRLLTPLHLDIDSSFQEIRNKEKEEIKTLNNQFAALIGKVQSLEQHNQVLLTRWNFLREQDHALTDLDIKLLYDQYMNKLRQEIRSIDVEKEQLDTELEEVLDAMDSFRSKYEEEINKRTGMEFTFTTLKKDLDNGFLHKTELEAKLIGLHAIAELMKNIYEQELEDVLSQTKDVSVVVGIDNNRFNPDPHKIVEDVRAQYEALAIRSWEELEELTRSKLNEGELLSATYGDHLLNDRRVIAELNIQIQKMRSCIVSLKSQCLHLEENIKEVGGQGEAALSDAKTKLDKLEEALHSARQNLAHMVMEYQELMNIKLALDIEILTYRKLMEGEEFSMESPPPAVISRIYSNPKPLSSNSSIVTSNVATRAREGSTEKMSRSGSSLESGLFQSQSGGIGGVSSGDFSRSLSNRSGGVPDGRLARGHSSGSGGTSEVLRSHSSTHKGNLESSLSRSTSSRSGNFADIEDTMESSISRSHGSFSQPDVHSRSQDNLEEDLSRSQSSRSGLTDSVFARTHSSASEGVHESNYSRSQSHRSVEFSPSTFSRTQSGESNNAPEIAASRNHSSGSGSISEGNCSRSQGSRSGGFADSVFARTRSGDSEDVSGGSLSRSHSGSSTSFVEGSVPRNQGDTNEIHRSYGNDEFAEPTVSSTNSAEDGGVPVGGVSRSHSGSGSYISETRLSRSQSGGSHGNEGYVEPTVSPTNRAEDGGVPVGGVSRSDSGASRNSSQGRLSRSQSGSSHGSEGNTKPTASRTSAEDGGVPVGGVSRSNSGISRNSSQGRLSRSQRDQSGGGFADTVFARVQGLREGSISRSCSGTNAAFTEGGASGSQSGEGGGISRGSGFRTPSIRSVALTDSVFIRTPSSAGEDVHEEMFSRIHSEARESVTEAGLSRDYSNENLCISEASLSEGHHSSSEGLSQSGHSRHYVGESRDYTGLSRSREASADSLSRSHSGESGGPMETSTPISHHSRNEVAVERNLSRTHSEESGSFRAADFHRSSSEASRVVSETSLSRSCSKENEQFLEGEHLPRHYSCGSANLSHSNVSRTDSGVTEDVPEDSQSTSHSPASAEFSQPGMYRSQSGEREDVSESGLSRSYGSRSGEIPEDNLYASHSGGHEGLPESGHDGSYSYEYEDASHSEHCRSHSAAHEGVCESGSSVEEHLFITHSGGSSSPNPICLIYEVCSDHHHHVPTDETYYYVESSTME